MWVAKKNGRRRFGHDHSKNKRKMVFEKVDIHTFQPSWKIIKSFKCKLYSLLSNFYHVSKYFEKVSQITRILFCMTYLHTMLKKIGGTIAVERHFFVIS